MEQITSADRVASSVRRRRPSGAAESVPTEARQRLLANVPLFRKLAPEQLAPVAELTLQETFERGAEIVRQGETGDSVYIIADGAVEVRTRSETEPEAPQAVVANLVAGDTVGELAVLDRLPRSATCVALTRTTCLVLHREQLLGALQVHWSICEALLTELAQRLRVADALLAEHARDPLTGLDNRRTLAQIYQRETARMRRDAARPRSRTRPMALLFADLDQLKKINDEHGHNVGDEVIKAAARVLTSVSRSGDAVIRYAGDEFVVLMPDTTLEGAEQAAARIRQALHDLAAASVPFTMSIGAAVVDPRRPPPPLEAVIAEADLRMYRHKAWQH